MTGQSVEIGVWLGDYSKTIINNWKLGDLHTMIDPYINYPCPKNGYSDKQCTVPQLKFDHIFKDVEEEMRKSFGNRTKMMRNFSVTSASKFEDSSLSFIYIDARHDYDAVREDLHTWWPKLKVGGIFSGHDFTYLPLAHAVVQFMENKTGTIYVTSEHPASWFVLKCVL